MAFSRALLLSSSLVLGVAAAQASCGGAVAPVNGDGGTGSSSGAGGSGSGGSSGGTGSTSGGGSSSGGIVDASALPDVIGKCQVDGVPCFESSQCCSGICGGNVCGGVGPTCSADGVACQTGSTCCSGICTGGACGQGVVSCGVSSNANPCDVCLAESCCPQVSNCDTDKVCAAFMSCYDGCYKGAGTGAGCEQSCSAQFSDAQVNALIQCGASMCLSSCQ